jgi:O-antigen ligase
VTTSASGAVHGGSRGRMAAVIIVLLLVAAAFGWGIGLVGPEAALAAPALLLVLAVLSKPSVGLFVVAFTIPFEAVLLIPGGSTITKALAVLVVLAWVFRKLLRRESWRGLIHSPVFIASVAFLGLAFLSRLWATYTVGMNNQLARLVLLFGLALLVMDLIRTWRQATWLARCLVLGGLVAAGLTLWQAYAGGARRAGGDVAGGINATALLLVCIMPFAFALARSTQGSMSWRLVGLIYLPVAGLAVIQTFSRMSLLMGSALLATEYVITLRSARGRMPLLALTAVAAVAFVSLVPMDKLQDRASTIVPYLRATLEGGSTGAMASTSGRGFHLRMALAVFEDHPLLGGGYWNFGRFALQYQYEVPGYSDVLQMPRSAHSSFFRILADLGLVGMSLWLALLTVTGRELWRAWKRTSKDPDAPAFMLVRATTFAFLLQQAYGFYAEMQIEKIFWVTLGLAVAMRGMAEPLGAALERDRVATPGGRARLAGSTTEPAPINGQARSAESPV